MFGLGSVQGLSNFISVGIEHDSEDFKKKRKRYCNHFPQGNCMKAQNIYAGIPADLPEEWVEVLANAPTVRIERIVSCGHASPPDFWYDQQTHEWVILLQGQAQIEYADSLKSVDLAAGDHLLIPAHTRHRVTWTSSEPSAIWLAVHYSL
jgi:cupin 2 domain-containing protein